MEENNRKNFLVALIENVKKSIEVEKQIDNELLNTKVREAEI